jgi:hypothetical protein
MSTAVPLDPVELPTKSSVPKVRRSNPADAAKALAREVVREEIAKAVER